MGVLMKKDYHIVSFSGGKDSTAMLLKMIEKNMQIDEIIFCDTGVEFDDMYNHINQVEHYIGRTITKISSERNFEYYLLNHIKTTRSGEKVEGYSFPGPRQRWCTSKLKIDVINRYISSLKIKYNVIEYIGIAYDEKHRAKEKIYPLIDWEMTEADCLEYCYKKGFYWGGLYQIFSRVSCWCCPLQPLYELRQLRKYYPDKWNTLLQWQSKTYRKFRADLSVEELEKRFAYEDYFDALFVKLPI